MSSTLYEEVSKVLHGVKQKTASLKTLIYASNYKNSRQLFAMTNECVKYQEILQVILDSCPKEFTEEEAVYGNTDLAIVYLYEYLVGRKFGRNVGLRKMMLKYKEEIKAAVGEILAKHEAKNLQQVVKGNQNSSFQKLPRYMRVNLMKSTVEAVIESMTEEGWDYVGKLPNEGFRDSAISLERGQFGVDPFLHDVFVFAQGTDLHSHHLTADGVLVQQDRASCVPAHVLSPPPGSVVLDCCAAPGNKTTHLASLMEDKGHVIALDRDKKRMSTLKAMVAKSGATCIEAIHQDFLTLEPNSEDVAGIQMVLVDPSCSGSGMPNQVKDDTDKDALRMRLQTLKRFQISILKHALRFTDVQKVVYSTCSIYSEENEEVVTEVMSHVADYFTFEPVIPDWTGSRGLVGFPDKNSFLRMKPERDLTQGFFVACFKRIKPKSQMLPDDDIPLDESEEMLADDDIPLDKSEEKSITKKRKHSESSNDNFTIDINVAEFGNEDQEHFAVGSDMSSQDASRRKKRKTNSKHSCLKDTSAEDLNVETCSHESVDVCESKEKQKREKKKNAECEEHSELMDDTTHLAKKKKKKKKASAEDNSVENISHEDVDASKSSKEKRRREKNKSAECVEHSELMEDTTHRVKKKKKKKDRERRNSVDGISEMANSKESKKDKISDRNLEKEISQSTETHETSTIKKKKKKKSKKQDKD